MGEKVTYKENGKKLTVWEGVDFESEVRTPSRLEVQKHFMNKIIKFVDKAITEEHGEDYVHRVGDRWDIIDTAFTELDVKYHYPCCVPGWSERMWKENEFYIRTVQDVGEMLEKEGLRLGLEAVMNYLDISYHVDDPKKPPNAPIKAETQNETV